MESPARYRKRPVVIEAIQWTGSNADAVGAFAGARFNVLDEPSPSDPDATAEVLDSLHSTWILVYTGDWIIRGVKGEFYPCRDNVFTETYEAASSTSIPAWMLGGDGEESETAP